MAFQVEPKSIHYDADRLQVLNFDSNVFDKKFNEYNTILERYVSEVEGRRPDDTYEDRTDWIEKQLGAQSIEMQR